MGSPKISRYLPPTTKKIEPPPNSNTAVRIRPIASSVACRLISQYLSSTAHLGNNIALASSVARPRPSKMDPCIACRNSDCITSSACIAYRCLHRLLRLAPAYCRHRRRRHPIVWPSAPTTSTIAGERGGGGLCLMIAVLSLFVHSFVRPGWLYHLSLQSVCTLGGIGFLLSESGRHQSHRLSGSYSLSLLSFFLPFLTRGFNGVLSLFISSIVMCTIIHLDTGAALQSSSSWEAEGGGGFVFVFLFFLAFLFFCVLFFLIFLSGALGGFFVFFLRFGDFFFPLLFFYDCE
ncbi:hypothetical protein BZA05DRAFT_201510 [Tricharina praecox]|uniref:uncharacterized protein n=1 Tax=Tricharina praecox TaxID=43433 RepID=UPI00221EFF02|nr:uncharacterized protein BZA05DRAFT_201510 [Tricharina praecox]KAI5856462.1 hypothetical protein BZA05DRAFT_201510 [Tricharina praecox]